MSPLQFADAVKGAASAAAPVNGHPAPQLVPRPLVEGSYSPGKLLSASQVNTFLRCQAQWMFKYFLGEQETTNGARHTGTAVHRVVEANSGHKMATGADMEPGAIEAEYERVWGEQQNLEWAADEDPGEQKAMGRRLVDTYLTEVSPKIQPAAMELPVEGAIGGVRFRGKLDILGEVAGSDRLQITDIKTSAKKQEPGADYQLQVTLYHLLEPRTSPSAQLVQITKTKEPKAYFYPVEVTAAKIAYAETIVPLAAEGMASGLYIPNRNSMLCSRKYCGYWRQCQREFGGEVA